MSQSMTEPTDMTDQGPSPKRPTGADQASGADQAIANAGGPLMSQAPAPNRVPAYVNTMMTLILRSPFHAMVSRQIMLITFTGRKSGRNYTTPISYTRVDNQVMAFTGGRWAHNLRGGAPVVLQLQGRRRTGSALLVDDRPVAVEALRAHLTALPGDAKYYGVTIDSAGQPNTDQVARAAEHVALLRITLD